MGPTRGKHRKTARLRGFSSFDKEFNFISIGTQRRPLSLPVRCLIAEKGAAVVKKGLDISEGRMYNILIKSRQSNRLRRCAAERGTGGIGNPMKRIAVIALLLALILLLSTGSGFAAGRESEHVNYITDVFNEETGLPTGDANAVVQAHNGYLWIGSYGGLIRYDGSNFTDFSDRLASSAIRSLFESSDGTLYIGTNDAGAYRFRDDVFTPLEAEDSGRFLCVRGFAEGREGTIYVASTTGVGKLDGTGIVPYRYAALEEEHFLSVVADRDGAVWAMSDSGNVCVFNDDAYLKTVSPEELFSEGTVYAIACGDRGDFFFGSSEGEMVKLRSRPDSLPGSVSTYDKTEYDPGGLGAINHVKPLADGRIIVSALNGFGFVDVDDVFHRVDTQADKNLSANWAEADHEGNFWVASSNYGLVRYSVGCFDSCNYNSDLGKYTVNAVTRAGDRYYVGTDSGVLIFDSDWNRLENDLSETLQGFRVRNAAVDTAGRVWLATYSAYGAACYDPGTGILTDYGEAQGINSEKIRVVYPLSDGRMLVGSQLGVNIIENGAVTESYSGADGLENTSVLCAMELNGKIYVGTDGSGIYDLTSGGLVHYGTDAGLTQGVVLRMEPDADGGGNYFVCAGDKLFYYENGSFRLLTGMDYGAGSLYSAYDVGGRIWLLQDGGVYAADKEDVLSGKESYTAKYGIRCGMTGTLSANTWNWMDEDGALYMPTRSGISKFYFRGPTVVTPGTILNSVTVDDRYYEHPTSLMLPRDARRVTVDISELLFSDTSEFLLAYQLEGFDTAETMTTDKHVSVSYTNLKGGSYTLKIRVIDPLTGASTMQTALSITKALRITESPWFYVICAALAAALVALLMRLYSRRQTRLLLKKQEEQSRYISDITKVFSECVDMRDAYTNGHSARVAKYTAMLAKKLGKSPEEVERMYRIALLHDVGKISIPDAVLNKPGRLTDEEYAIMKSHSQRGYEVLKDIDLAPDLALGAGCHHERYDGKGYPNGLKGDEIPEVAQIIGVADTFDAMYSTRPYRRKMPLEEVVAEIRRCRGTQLSPQIVDAFLQLVDDGELVDDAETRDDKPREQQ